MKIRKDDQVMVIGGKDSGKTGRVVRTEPKRNASTSRASTWSSATSDRAPSRTRPKAGQVGGIVEKEGPIHVSNVMLLDPKDNKPTRVGVRRDKGGKRERYSKRRERRF